ncbi:MAG: hypothetical protein ACLFOY_19025, partial [Desulfatibacillaceae bacterium]
GRYLKNGNQGMSPDQKEYERQEEANEFLDATALTLDTDWAPDAAIDEIAKILVSREVRATWFVTHDSPAIRRLQEHPELFEIGIHPNFLPGSTHGHNPEQVLDFCQALVPSATSMRTHGLFQYTNLLNMVMKKTRIRVDVSLFLPAYPVPRPFVHPTEHGGLIRVPYVWEDDFEMLHTIPDFEPGKAFFQRSGLLVLDYHPIHVYLNSRNMAPYREMLASGGYRLDMPASGMDEYVNKEVAGVMDHFMRLVESLALSGGGERISDIALNWAGKWRNNGGGEVSGNGFLGVEP